MMRKAVDKLVPVEVKYRFDIARFLRREAPEFFVRAKRWPGLYLVLATDNPEAGRSCFRVAHQSGQDSVTPGARLADRR